MCMFLGPGVGVGVRCGWGGASDAVGEAGKGFLGGTFEGDPPTLDLDLGGLTTTVPSLYGARGGGFVCFTAGDTEAGGARLHSQRAVE